MLHPVEHKCPECGRIFESGRGVGPHRRMIHGVKGGRKPRESKGKQPARVEKKFIKDPSWDVVCERRITSCPQCGQPRRAIKVNCEGTTLQCQNWQCPLFLRPMDNAQRVIVIPVTIETRKEPIETEVEDG